MRKTLILLLLFVACNNNSNQTQPSTIKLTYWSANNQYEIDLAETLVEKWNQTHPDVQVKHQPIPEGRSSEEVVLASVVGKTTPDVYSNMWPGDVETYIRANALIALDQFADYDSFATSRLSSEIQQESQSSDGRVYQILWKTNPIMMIYNKKMFAEAGFERPPATYDEFLAAAQKITRDRDGDGYSDQWIGITQIMVTWWQRFFDYYTLYIAASGGKTLLNNGDVAFDNQTSVEVLQFLQTLFRKGYFPKERMDARADVFLHSVVATRFTGPWEITRVEKFKPKGFEYDFAPVPRPASVTGSVCTYGDYKSIVVFSNTKYPQKAWQFAKFLVTIENDLRLLKMANQLPLRKDVLRDSLFQSYFARNPKMTVFAQQAQRVRGADSSPVLREIFDAISQEFEACVIYGVKTPEEAVTSAAKRARLLTE